MTSKDLKLIHEDALQPDPTPTSGMTRVHAITADGLQGTWQVIDQLSAATQGGKTYFGAQTPVSDAIAGQSICQLISVPRPHALPPTVAPFSALLALFQTP